MRRPLRRQGLAVSVTVALGAGASLCASAGRAAATYSIAAVDGATRQVGGAGASCIGDQSVRIIYGVAPGRGVVHAQAQINVDGRDEAVSLLERELAPADIVAAVTAPEFDLQAARRQYGVVDLSGRAAGFTGDDNGVFAGDRQGQAGPFTFAVQGNILTGPGVIDRAAAAFEAGGCDLADRLMLALEAGAENGEGDSRCTPSGVPADSAFLEVDLPDAPPGSYLLVDVTGSGSASPVALLREQYDAWRADHPCPAPPDAAPEPDPGEPDAAGPPGAGDAGPDGGGSTGGSAEDGAGDGGGCGCHSSGERDALASGALRLLLLALALAAVMRRAPFRRCRASPLKSNKVLEPLPIAVAEVAPGGDPVAHELLDLLGLGEAPLARAGEQEVAVQADLEDAAPPRYQRHLADIIDERGQELLRQPGGAQQPAALRAVLDLDARSRHP